MGDQHGIDGPENQGEASNGTEEGGRLAITGHDQGTTLDGKLKDNDQVGDASNGVVSPRRLFLVGQSSKEADDDHDEIGHDRHEHVRAIKTSQESQVQEQEWSGESPIDVASPVHLTVDVGVDGREVLLRFLDDDGRVRDAITLDESARSQVQKRSHTEAMAK